MSNFNIFNKEYVRKILEPFAPGISEHITPIKYEAITPDCFLFLFRTTDKENNNHFFVCLETDNVNDLEGAKCTIEDWYGNKVTEFWPLSDKRNSSENLGIKDYQSKTDSIYFSMLAKVEKPTAKGYWSDAILIMPGDKISDKISGQPEDVQANIRNALNKILKNKIDPNASFLDSYNNKTQDTIKNDINQTNMAVSVYVQSDGNVELFYNYVK